MKTRPEDQPLPTESEAPSCHAVMLKRMSEHLPQRLSLGIERYGQPLRPLNGRDFAQDAWEEYLDLGVYFTGLVHERELLIEKLSEATRALRAAGVLRLANDYESVLAGMGRPTRVQSKDVKN